MDMILGFAPFLLFAILSHTVGAVPGLLAGALAAAALVARDLVRGRQPKILELGTLLLFAILCLYSLAVTPEWSLMQVRLLVDSGLLLIVLGSLLIGKPFTIQYAREGVAPEYWNTPAFLEVNQRITKVWAIAFVVLVSADLLLLFAPQVSPHIGIALTIAALFWATKQTEKYRTAASS